MRIFFITFIFLAVISIYPKVTPYFLEPNAPTIAVTSRGKKYKTPPTVNNHIKKYKDGNYKGSISNAYYGNVQIEAIVNNGKISDIKFLKFPNNNSNSRYLNEQALPYLKKEVLNSQTDKVDVISGATYTSLAFIQSTKSALLKALN